MSQFPATPPGGRRNANPGPSPRRVVARLVPTAATFVRAEAASGIVLLAALVAALVWANSPWSDSYDGFWHAAIAVDALGIDTDLLHIVNDGLMTLFFYVVGLEIKRELVEGELATGRQAALPVAAAIGGMAGPALIYAAFTAGSEGAHGWGIPMATDIAMAAGVLALLGSRVPAPLKVFLLALAIVDDIGGIIVIALFYTAGISPLALLGAGMLLVVLVAIRAFRMRSTVLFGLLGLLFWLAVLASGVHATIAGVVLAMLTSAGTRDDPGESPLDRLESLLHPWTRFLVVPVFALANGGVEITRSALETAIEGNVATGIFAALVLGKPIGITLAALLAVRTGIARLPDGVRWSQIAGAGALGGIGFTVSLFIAGLAFEGEAIGNEARIGILGASVVAGVVGYAWLRLAGDRPNLPSP